jgi:hypothetical protein
MEWDVQLDPAFAAEAKQFTRMVQLEIAALAGFTPAVWSAIASPAL